ncbi:MAG: hypothetical protein WD267_12320 [Balneolales bacterium]
MITQFVWIVQGSLDNGTYPDALYYIDMVRDFNFFEASHLSFRVVVPFLVGSITNLLGITTLESISFIFGAWNFALFIFGMGVMLKIAIHEQSINVFELILPAILIVFMPFFISAAFYPVPEAGIFLSFSLILLSIFYKNLPLLFVITIISIWVSETAILAVLLVPAFNFIRNDNWWQAYFPFLVALLIYVFVVQTLSPDLSEHYLFNSQNWMQNLISNFLNFDRYFFIMLLPSFGLIIPFIAYCFYRSGAQKTNLTTLILFISYYLIFLLTSPENTPRLMFMTLPLLILFNFNDKTIIKN